jgi:hypothetical protein
VAVLSGTEVSPEVNTEGWDVACAYALERVNEGLVRVFREAPMSVEFEEGSVSFGPWRIIGRSLAAGSAAGGSELLDVEMPVTAGLWKGGGAPVDLAGALAVVEIQLGFVDAAATEGVRDLCFRLEVAGKEPGDITSGAVTVKAIVPPPGRELRSAVVRAFGDALVERLLAEREKLGFVLARLDLAPKGPGSWLALRRARHCFAQGGAGRPAYLVLLGMLDAGGSALPQAAIDPGLLDGSDQSVAFAPRVFLAHVLRPTFARGYGHGASEASFAVSDDALVNTVSLPFGDPSQGATISRLTVRVVDDHVETNAQGTCGLQHLRKGAWMEFTFRTRTPFRFDPATGGCALLADPRPEFHYVAHDPPPERLSRTERLWRAIRSAGFSEALAPLGPLVDGYVTRVVATGVARALEARASEMNLLEWTTRSIGWTNSPPLRVREAGLSDAFYLRCSAST